MFHVASAGRSTPPASSGVERRTRVDLVETQPGRLGQQQGEEHPGSGGSACDEEHAPQADVGLELRD